jgi:4-carboxymuconolactone decarboxylase
MGVSAQKKQKTWGFHWHANRRDLSWRMIAAVTKKLEINVRPILTRSLIAAATLLVCSLSVAQQRIQPIPAAQYDAEQKKAAEEFLAARKGPVFGPFEVMMPSPGMMSAARNMGDYLRFASAIGNTLSEMVILITAREWTQDYEWFVHQPIAVKMGIPVAMTDAIRDGRRPTGMSADQETVYDFVIELLRNHRVADATYQRAQARFGDKGVVDIAGIAGYYSLLAMEMNTARYEGGDPSKKLPRFP